MFLLVLGAQPSNNPNLCICFQQTKMSSAKEDLKMKLEKYLEDLEDDLAVVMTRYNDMTIEYTDEEIMGMEFSIQAIEMSIEHYKTCLNELD